MINFIKRFRKGHLSNDPVPVAALFLIGPCRKSSLVKETSKQCLVEKGNDGIKIGADDGFSQVHFASSNSEEEPVIIGHPKEPCEIDHPIRCPHPEPCIIQDGRALKERVPSRKRRGQLPFVDEKRVTKVALE